MSQKNRIASFFAGLRASDDLFSRTLRSVVVLVGACVLFVGTLSIVAVAITSKAVGAPASGSSSDGADGRTTAMTKKPVSI